MLASDVARGIEVRHDWGSQYRSAHFHGSLAWLGCAERWIRTLKEQCLWARTYRDVDDLRQAVAASSSSTNREWLIERLGHRTPQETYQQWLAGREQAA